MGELIGAAQAAKEAGVNRQYILNLIHEEIIKGQIIGNAYVIDRDSFDPWLEKHRQRRAGQAKQAPEGEQDAESAARAEA